MAAAPYGGVIEATWQACVARGLVSGQLRDASRDALLSVLRAECWGPVCDAAPAGLDLLIGNGRMMTGFYVHLVQQCLGFIGSDVDGDAGPDTMGVLASRDATTLINAIHGRHYAYLSELSSWKSFGVGWTRRLLAAHAAALAAV